MSDVFVPSVPNLFSSVKLAQLLRHQPLLDRYLGLVDLKERDERVTLLDLSVL